MQKKCKYTIGNGGKRLDCINAVLRKLKRPLCSVCRTRIKFNPPSKKEVPEIEPQETGKINDTGNTVPELQE